MYKIAKLSSKGQITLPKAIRERGLVPNSCA